MKAKFVEPTYQVEVYHRGIVIVDLLKESELISQYVDYFNNFLTVERFAEHYRYPLKSANYVIKKGKELLDKQRNKSKINDNNNQN